VTSDSPTKVVIAGGGTAGWIAAAAISNKLEGGVDVTLVESDQIGTVGVGEATIPPMRVFHKLLRIDEQEVMRATSATFKLGIGFENWGKIGDQYIHSFGKTGKETWLADFHHFWLSAVERGSAAEYGEYCLEWAAAKAGKFATGPESDINYAYHLDATLYAKFLRERCKNVRWVEGLIEVVNQHSETGFIESITLDSGDTIEGDLFIDCTGFRGLLIEQALKTGYESWAHWLPSDSAVAVQTRSMEPALPYTRSIAHDCGWRWKIPLQHRVGNGLVYCSKYISDDEATARLLNEVDSETVTDPRVIKFGTGRRLKGWNKNCVAFGLSSGFVEPLESTSIHLIMMGVTRLMQIFPFDGISQPLVDQYNAEAQLELEKIRDFIILHYNATERDDSSFWRYCRDMEIPESLAHRIALFKETGRAYQSDGELFRVDSWTQVMLGQGIVPERYHQLARAMSDNELQQFLNSLQSTIGQKIESLPDHQTFVDHYCKSSLV